MISLAAIPREASLSTITATPSAAYRTYLGLAFGVAAGALWGLVFLAPELVHSFSPLELAAGRYLAYGVISVMLILPRWRALRAALHPRDWQSLVWLALAARENWLCCFAHDPAIAFARIQADPKVKFTVASRIEG